MVLAPKHAVHIDGGATLVDVRLTSTASNPPVSTAKIPPALDRQMDQKQPTNGETLPGVSIRNGPVTEDVLMKDVNGSASNSVKRKVSRPSYADAESSDDDKPIVRLNYAVEDLDD